MQIQSTGFTVAPMKKPVSEAMRPFLADPSHRFAVTTDIGRTIGIRSQQSVQVAPDLSLSAVDSADENWTPEQRLKFEKSAITLGKAVIPILKKSYPAMTPAFDGMDVIFAAKSAFDAFADPDRQSFVKPAIKTTRAVFEAIDVVKLAVPGLNNVPYLNAFGIAVKVGDAVYQFCSDFREVRGLGD